MKIFAIANQKGGVGKTTCCINIAAALALCNQKVLLVDLDPQGNATMGSGANKNTLTLTINEVLLGKATLTSAILAMPGGYDLLPANGTLTIAEVSLLQQQNREYKLLHALAEVAENYDYILFDCPPALNMLTMNALVAATGVIIPMQCEYYALEGLSALLETMEQVRTAVNPKLQVEGIVLTMYDPRNRLATDVEQQLKQHFKNKVYNTAIPRNVRLAEAPSHGVPIMLYDKSSRGAIAYINLVAEMLQQHQAKTLATTKLPSTATANSDLLKNLINENRHDFFCIKN